VGRREGALERVGVGEEGAEVVDGADEVVEVGAAELLDLGLPVPHRGTERGEQRLGAAARERPAHEGAQVLPSRARSASDGAQADCSRRRPLLFPQVSSLRFPPKSRRLQAAGLYFPPLARFPPATRSPARLPSFPRWSLTYGARLIQLDAQETPMDA